MFKVLPNCQLGNSLIFLNKLPSLYQKIQQTRQFVESPKCSQHILESLWFVGFSGKSLQKERQVEISYFSSDCQINPQHADRCYISPHPFTPPSTDIPSEPFHCQNE